MQKEEYQHFGERKQLLWQHKRSETVPSCFWQQTKRFCDSWTVLSLHSSVIPFTKQSCSLKRGNPPISLQTLEISVFTLQKLQKKTVFDVFQLFAVSQTCFLTSFVEENREVTTKSYEIGILHFWHQMLRNDQISNFWVRS